jgi:hypothetical protein
MSERLPSIIGQAETGNGGSVEIEVELVRASDDAREPEPEYQAEGWPDSRSMTYDAGGTFQPSPSDTADARSCAAITGPITSSFDSPSHGTDASR